MCVCVCSGVGGGVPGHSYSYIRKTFCSFVASCCDRCAVTEHACDGFIYWFHWQRREEKEASLAMCAHSWHINCDKQWENGPHMIWVDCTHSHELETNTHTDSSRIRRSQVPQWNQMGGSFPSADLLRAEELLRAGRWQSDLTDRVSEKREREI